MQNYLHYKDLENNTSNHHPNKNKNLRFGELTICPDHTATIPLGFEYATSTFACSITRP